MVDTKEKQLKMRVAKLGCQALFYVMIFFCFHVSFILTPFSLCSFCTKKEHNPMKYVITIMNFNMFVFNALRNKHNCQLTTFCNSLFLLCFCLCFAFLLSIDIFGKFLKNKKKYWSRVQLAICKQKTEIFCYQTTNLFQIWFLFLVSKKALKVNLQLNLQGF